MQSTVQSRALLNIHFTVLAYAPEEICLPYLICMSYCNNTIYGIVYTDLTLLHIKLMYVLTNMPFKCQINTKYANYYMCTQDNYVSKYTSYDPMQSIM